MPTNRNAYDAMTHVTCGDAVGEVRECLLRPLVSGVSTSLLSVTQASEIIRCTCGETKPAGAYGDAGEGEWRRLSLGRALVLAKFRLGVARAGGGLRGSWSGAV